MYQLIERDPRIAKTIAALLVASAPIVAAGSMVSARAPQAGGCTTYLSNVEYPLRRCDKGPAIRVLQTALHVVDPGLTVDGYFGIRTERALLDYEQIWGLPAIDGIVDAHTWSSLTWQHAHGTDANANGIIDPWELSTEAPPPPPQPQPGPCASYRPDYAYPMQLCGRGEGIRIAQKALRLAGDDRVVADGFYGPITQAAVRAFQTSHGLPVTGEIDEPTWAALTQGTATGHDADGDGIVDPWELGSGA